ncbi:hypothetical protein BgiBS90_027599, partial [Biomphalaria glabrata]
MSDDLVVQSACATCTVEQDGDAGVRDSLGCEMGVGRRKYCVCVEGKMEGGR